jgi:hypothetical protein
MNLEEATIPEPLSDFNIALNLVAMITGSDNLVIGGQIYDTSDFYIKQAREILPTLKNPNAIQMVENVIKIYES